MTTGLKPQKNAKKRTRPIQRAVRGRNSRLQTKTQSSPLRDNLLISRAQLRDFCERWAITELALFGSVLRKDFRPNSDVDVLVTFAPTAHPTLLDLAHMQSELETLFGRKVDLLTRRGVESSRNPIRRQGILSSAETVYVA